MDLSKLSTDDLLALKSGDLSKVSTDGLLMLRGETKSSPSFSEMFKAEALTSLPGGFARGVKDVIDTGAGFLSRLGGKDEAARIAAENAAGKVEFEQASKLVGAGGSGITRLGGQVAATAPLVSGLGAVVGQAAPRLGHAISTFGGSTGGLSQGTIQKLIDLGIRSAGGGIAGGVAAGAVEPESAGTGALIGTAMPPALAVITPAAKYVSTRGAEILDLFRGEKGAENILNRYTKRVVGEQNMPKVIEAAKSTTGATPGYRPTLAEGISQLPEASPMVAQQKITAQESKGLSSLFGNRKLEQDAAIAAAEVARKNVTTPMREASLAAANENGINAVPIIEQINALAMQPGERASDVVTKTLGSVSGKLDDISRASGGYIDARDLYTIRKEVGTTIKKYAKETENWDKKLTSKLEREIQLFIDDAIESAGGVGWKDYLAEFSKRSKQMETDLLRREMMYTPPQSTNLRGGVDIANESRLSTPNLLYRPAMLANWGLKQAGAGIESKVDRIAAERFLNPDKFAAAFEKATPEEKYGILKAAGIFGSRAAPLLGNQ
jgi:hypothetical protein